MNIAWNAALGFVLLLVGIRVVLIITCLVLLLYLLLLEHGKWSVIPQYLRMENSIKLNCSLKY